MNHRKRILTTIVSLALIFSIMPVQSVKADGENTTQITEKNTNAVEADISEDSSAVAIESLEGTDSVEKNNLAIQYLYVKTPYLVTPDTQEILVSFNEGVSVTDAVLVYRNDSTGETLEEKTSKIEGSSVVFHIDFADELYSGIYQLTEVKVTIDGTESCINLQETGIDSRFGVNQECDTEPDAIIEEDDELSASEEAGVEVTFMTLSDNGEVTETSSAEEALSIAGVEAQEGSEQSQVYSRAVTYSEDEDNVVVVLDPGHGGWDPGATGNGVKEKDLTLKIAKYCKEELEEYRGVSVYMTRTEDQSVSGTNNTTEDLKARVAFAKEKNADVLVSIHLNATGTGAGYGAEVYFPNSNYRPDLSSQGKELAQDILDELVDLGLKGRGIIIRNSENGSTYPDGSTQDYYSLIWRSKEAGFPALIVEHAFIDNLNDYNNYLSSDAKLQKLGQADATGIANYFGLAKGEWKQDANGWRFEYADGTYPKNCWKYISGAWYYFDASGYRMTDFQKIGESTYYFSSDGKMVTGWKKINNSWYYFASSGAMCRSSWLLDGNTWYYLGSDGKMVTGWQTIGGLLYYFGTSGNMYVGKCTVDGKAYDFGASGGIVYGWIQSGNRWWYRHTDGTYTVSDWELIGGSWYYFDASGWMVTGWQKIGSHWYYFETSGAMATGWKCLSNTWYYLNAAGEMLVGKQEIGEDIYYFNSSGAMMTGWQLINGDWSYFTASGAMAKDTWIGNYYVDSEGVWKPEPVEAQWIQSGDRWWYRHADGSYTTSDWEEIDGSWYYFDASGWMVTGWQLINNNWYYFTSSGTMAKDTWIGDCYVDSNGVWQQETKQGRWIQSGDRWWYRHADGSYTVSNWEMIDGSWYYFDASGWRVTGWQMVGNTWYYLNEDGKMATGWKTLDGITYYLNSDGAMCTGYKEINGEWYFFNNKQAPLGMLSYTGVTSIMGSSELGNDKSTVVSKLVKMYNKRGMTYPSEIFSKGGAADIQTFCEILYEEAIAENVKPEVVFGQAMKETGYLQYGGDVKPEQYNFAGLGAVGGGASGASFTDVREGLRAQIQHLKAYASDEELNQPCVDPRFGLVTRNVAPYVEWLGISENPAGRGWASAIGYGMSLMNDYINPMLAL